MAGLKSLWALSGRWTLVRRIRHADGREDRFEGETAFRRSGPRLVQDEDGVLVTAGGAFRASRRYVWSRQEGRLEVSFADMRPFHTVPLGVARPSTTYLCPPDRYSVTYDFTGWPEWRSEWRVEGPSKDYVMSNLFSPAEPDSGAGPAA